MKGAWSYYNAGDYEKSIEQGKQALSAAKKTGNKEREADAYNVLAWSYYRAGDYEKSIEQGKQALSGSKETGNKGKEADEYDVLAWSYYRAGDYEKSIEQGKQALSAAKETGNKELEAAAYTVLAWSYYEAEDYEKSIEQGKQALSGAKETGNKEWEAKAYKVLAWSYYRAGDYEKSTEAHKDLAKSYDGLGDHIQARFHDERSEKILEERGLEERSGSEDSKETKEEEYAAYAGLPSSSSAEQLLHDDGDDNDDGDVDDDNNDTESDSGNNDDGNDGFVSSSFCVGDDDGNHGNMGDAVNDEVSEEQDLIQELYTFKLEARFHDDRRKTILAERGLEERTGSGNKERDAEAFTVLAWSYYKAGDYEKSITNGNQALSAAMETGNKEWDAEAFTVLAWSYYRAGDYGKSIKNGNQALSAAMETGNKERNAQAFTVLAWSYYKAGDYVKSRDKGNQALSAAKKTGNKEWEAEAHKVLAKSYHRVGDHIEARFHDDRRKKILAERALEERTGSGDFEETKEEAEYVAHAGLPSSSSEEQDLIQQFHELQKMGQEGDPVEQDPDKTKIHEGTVTSEGAHWDLKQGAVQLAFSPGAVSEPISIMVLKWKCSACSPQLQEHEAIVSNVIEISTKNGQPLEFNAQVMLMLYHSAPNLQGYELVIKMQIDKEISEWVDVDGTEDLRRLRGIDTYASSQDMPDLNCFIARANITECSTYAVVFRLKSSPPYTITSNGGSFSHPYYPGVTVDIPEKAVAPNTTFPLVLKAQEIPIEEFEGQDVFVGPALQISCSRVVEFLKPVTIHLPVHVRGGPKGIPDPSSYHVRVLFLRSDGEYKEWIDITSDLEHPASFDGTFVKFQVKHFSKYTCILSGGRKFLSHLGFLVRRLSSLTRNPPMVACFFAYIRPSPEPWTVFILCLICCTAHFREVVKKDIKEEGVTASEDHSTKPMIPGHDEVFVSVSRGESDADILKDFNLRFESDAFFKKELEVHLCSDQGPLRVKFYSTPSKEKLLSTCTLFVPTPSAHHTASEKPTPNQQPAVRPRHHPGTDNVYNMTAHTRGITLIINNNLFEHDIQPTRDGSEEDVREVAALFHALGFNVDTKENLTRPQLLEELNIVACLNHSGYDCFVLWLMSHGKSGKVLCYDGKMLPIQTAQDMLSKCTTLRDKPKLFFIQACRGKKKDEGFADKTDELWSLEDPPGHVNPPSDADNPSASRIRSPTHADFLYSYATVDGYVSYRRSDLGSRYVRALVDVFRERAHLDDLLSILTTVNRKVSEMVMRMPAQGSESDIKNLKQMPEVKHTLRKQLWF